MAYYPAHQATMHGENLGTGMQPCATRTRYPVQRSAKSGGEAWASRKPDTIHGPSRSNCRPDRGNPRRTAVLRRSNIYPLQSRGHMVTIVAVLGRWNPHVDAPRYEQVFGDPYPSRAASYVTLCIRPSSRPAEKYPPFGTLPTMIIRLVADIQNRLFWWVGIGRAVLSTALPMRDGARGANQSRANRRFYRPLPNQS